MLLCPKILNKKKEMFAILTNSINIAPNRSKLPFPCNLLLKIKIIKFLKERGEV
jgi:hypothetical protein